MLTDGQNAWRGEVSEEVLRSEAEELEMSTQRYVQDLQEALTGGEGSSSSYSFSLRPRPLQPNTAITLTYEKMQSDISFRLGQAELQVDSEPVESVRKLLEHNLERGERLERENLRLERENHRLRGEHTHITDKLKRYSAGKESLETELYSRFVLVLNEKKSKLRSLQETLSKLQDKRTAEQQKDSAAGQEDDEYGGSTDEEPQETKEEESIKPAPESSARSSLDDSLSDITDVAPSRKRRFRHLEAPGIRGRKSEAEKTTATQGKRTCSPAGSSQTSGRSADAAESSAVEDLFEDF